MNWDTDDQDKALAWQIDEADKCPGCGTRSYERVTTGTVSCSNCRTIHIAREDQEDKPWKHLTVRRVHGEPS